jgi:tetratricopeptide (TPR) repeat protein
MKRLQTVLLLALITACCVISCATSAAVKHKQRDLYGMIYDGNNKPVDNAAVSINGKHIVSSDIHGHFAIPDIRSKAKYRVSVRKEFYETLEMDISFSDPAYILYLRMVSAEQLLAAAEEALQKKHWSDAESLLDRAEQAGAGSISAAYLRGILAYNRNQYGKALDFLIRLEDEEIRAPYLFLLIADIYQYRLEDKGKALAYLQKFLELRYDPEVRERVEALNRGD